MRRRTVFLLLGLLLLAAVVGLSLSSRRRPESGLVDGRLRACPTKPNCVCSQDPDEGHLVEPLQIIGDPDEAFAALVGRLKQRHELLHLGDDYAHFELVSSVLRFRRDLELLVDREARLIHVRSASRVGHTDLGANRRRVEALRAALLEP